MSIGKTTSLVLLLACGIISGCGDDAARTDGARAGSAIASAADWTPSLEELPDCDEMPALLGGLVDGLIPVEDSDGQGKYDNVTVYGVNCTWLTPRAKSGSPFEQIKAGALTIGITVDQDPQDEAVLRQLGMVFDDPRAEAIDGFVIGMGKSFDPASPLGVVGPQVVFGRTTINMAGGGVYLQRVEELAPVTNDRVIAASVDLYKAMQAR